MKGLNVVECGALKSDFAAEILGNPGSTLGNSMFDVEDDPDDYPQTISLNPAFWAGSAQVDHIIPRVDIRGCRCGTNQFANAAINSAWQNVRMSNDMNHPDRIKALCQWTNPSTLPSNPCGGT